MPVSHNVRQTKQTIVIYHLLEHLFFNWIKNKTSSLKIQFLGNNSNTENNLISELNSFVVKLHNFPAASISYHHFMECHPFCLSASTTHELSSFGVGRNKSETLIYFLQVMLEIAQVDLGAPSRDLVTQKGQTHQRQHYFESNH